LELESVSSRGEVVEERDEEERSVTVSYDDEEAEGEDKDRSFTLSGEHSGDRSYDSYADNFSVGDYAGSQGGSGSVRIRAAPPPGSEADTSGSYSENFDTTSASLSSLGQPISTRFFPISFPRPSSGYSPGGNSGSNGHHTDSHRSRRSAYSSHIESPRPRRSSAHDSLLSHGPDSILSHGPDSIVSQSHGSTASLAQDDSLLTSRHDDSIVSIGQDSMISSPARSQRSGSTGLIPPPPHNPNQRRRRAGTEPSVISAESIESLSALRRRVESHTVRPGIPAEFRGLSDEAFEDEREDSVGMLSAPSSRKNSLVAMNQRGRRGRVSSSGSGSAGSRGSASGGSRAVSGTSGGSRAVSGSSGMSGSAGSRAVSGASNATMGLEDPSGTHSLKRKDKIIRLASGRACGDVVLRRFVNDTTRAMLNLLFPNGPISTLTSIRPLLLRLNRSRDIRLRPARLLRIPRHRPLLDRL
ncbi:hypothetical protein RSAG8_03669, partial [Rhizoctonia solani AG-8 WAC10335]